MAAFSFPIEAGHVLQFRRAIGEVDGDGGAPPATFAMAADHFDPDYERRPRPGTTSVGVAPSALFHVEQRFDYHRHPTLGEVLVVERVEPRRWTKQGRRGGRLDFVELVTTFADQAGRPVITALWLDVATERSHASLSAGGADPPPGPSGPAEGEGDELTMVVADPVTRTQMTMYVGAAGDFHPLHHDEVYARAHGYPGVFAPGMLTMALSGRAVTEAAGGVARIAAFGGRLTTQVWPGDRLTTRLARRAPASAAGADPGGGEPGGGEPRGGELTVVTRTDDGRVVFDGWARIAG